jgi:uncharacterized protein (DUF58 family)
VVALFFSRSVAVLSLAFALLLIGVNAQAGWMFWLAGLLVSGLLVSWALSLWQVRNLSISRHHKGRVGEDELLEVALDVRNHGRFSRHLLEVVDEDPCLASPKKQPRLRAPRKKLGEYLSDPTPPHKPSPEEGGGRAAFLIPRLEGGGNASIVYRRRGLRRGVYRDWPGFFYSEGLLGLARHTSRARVESSLVVYPSYAELGSFPLTDSFLHPQETSHDFFSKGVGAEYFGLREWRAGDPLRHVHWRTTARRGELVVREFEREVGTPLTILIDNRAHHDPGGNGYRPLDHAARLAASIAHYAYFAGHPVSLAAYEGGLLQRYFVSGFQAALEWLASLRPEGALAPEEQLEGLAPELESGSFLCCIFPAEPLDRLRLAAALPPRCHVSLVLVDPPAPKGARRFLNQAASAEEVISELIEAPFGGLFSVSLYHEGDDLKTCLEKPLIIFESSRPLER